MAIEKDNRIQLPNNIRTKVNVPGKQGQIEQIQGNLQQQQNFAGRLRNVYFREYRSFRRLGEHENLLQRG